MIDDQALEKLQNTSIEERIVIIEAILTSLKSDIKKQASPQSVRSQRPAFGFMKDTGEILGDVVAPVLPESFRILI